MDESWGQNPSLRYFFFSLPPPTLLAEYLSLSDEEERVGKRIEAKGCRLLKKKKKRKNPFGLKHCHLFSLFPPLFSRQRAIINALLSPSSLGGKSWGKREGEKERKIEKKPRNPIESSMTTEIIRYVELSPVVILLFTLVRGNNNREGREGKGG